MQLRLRLHGGGYGACIQSKPGGIDLGGNAARAEARIRSTGTACSAASRCMAYTPPAYTGGIDLVQARPALLHPAAAGPVSLPLLWRCDLQLPNNEGED